MAGLGDQEKGGQLAATRRNFLNFVGLLVKKLKDGPVLVLTLTLHALNSHYPGYDYRALGQIADRLIVMAYDYGPKPEPVNLVRRPRIQLRHAQAARAGRSLGEQANAGQRIGNFWFARAFDRNRHQTVT